MNSARNIFAIITIFSGLQSFSVARTSARTGGPKAVCRIIVRDAEQNLLSLCSGLLVAPSEVLTAGHCAIDYQTSQIEVQCGYQGFNQAKLKIEATRSGNRIQIGGPQFSENHKVKKIAVEKSYIEDRANGIDVAKFTLTEKSSITQLQVAGIGEVSSGYISDEGRMRKGVRCMLSGFGMKSDLGGDLHFVEIPKDVLFSVSAKNQYSMAIAPLNLSNEDIQNLNSPDRKQAAALLKKIIIAQKVPATGRPGDSGSSVLCQKDGGALKSIGVYTMSAVGFSSDARSLVLTNSFWSPYSK